MATPTALTDIVILLAVLLGSITAGVMFARPLRSGRRIPPGADPATASRRKVKPPRPLPPMLGGDIFTGEVSAPLEPPQRRR